MSTHVKTAPHISTPRGCPRPSRLASCGGALALGVAASLAAPPASATGIVVMPGSTAGYLYFPNAAAAPAPAPAPAPPPGPEPVAPSLSMPVVPNVPPLIGYSSGDCFDVEWDGEKNIVVVDSICVRNLFTQFPNKFSTQQAGLNRPSYNQTACEVEFSGHPTPATCNRVQAIHLLFNSLLGRNPDVKSFHHWFYSNHSIDVINHAIKQSPEYMCHLSTNKGGFSALGSFTFSSVYKIWMAYSYVYLPFTHTVNSFDFKKLIPNWDISECQWYAAVLSSNQSSP